MYCQPHDSAAIGLVCGKKPELDADISVFPTSGMFRMCGGGWVRTLHATSQHLNVRTLVNLSTKNHVYAGMENAGFAFRRLLNQFELPNRATVVSPFLQA